MVLNSAGSWFLLKRHFANGKLSNNYTGVELDFRASLDTNELNKLRKHTA